MDSKTKSVAICVSLLLLTTILIVVCAVNGKGTNGSGETVSINTASVSTDSYHDFLNDETFFDDADDQNELTVDTMPRLYMQATSVYKDIRVSVTDELGNPVEGIPFEINVSDSGEYKDIDMDGIINIPEISAGEYYVSIGNVVGYIVPSEPMRVSVKDELEYNIIDNIDLYICSEDEINALIEDTRACEALEYADDTEKTEIIRDGSAVFGIDVSKWQGDIDWQKVKESGVEFVIIRAGYRGSVTGALVEDPMFKEYLDGATAAGIPIGVYFFSQAVSEVEAVEEASMIVSLIDGYDIKYPIFLDSEGAGGSGRADLLSTDERTTICKAFCETINSAGYHGGVYASRNWFNNRLNASELEDYIIWDAEYVGTPGYAGRYDMWQYTSSGNIAGINTRVDLDICYVSFE